MPNAAWLQTEMRGHAGPDRLPAKQIAIDDVESLVFRRPAATHPEDGFRELG